MKKLLLIILLLLFLTNLWAQNKEIELDEVEILGKQKTAKDIIKIVAKKIPLNYIKKDTISFKTSFLNKEEKLDTLYYMKGYLDLFFDNYFNSNNNYYDAYLYNSYQLIDNSSKILNDKKENYVTFLRHFLNPEIIIKIINKSNVYNFSFINKKGDSWTIELKPKDISSWKYEGEITIDKNSYAILNFSIQLVPSDTNNIRTMFGSSNDSYHVPYYKTQCSFNKNTNYFKLDACQMEAQMNQKGNFNRKYHLEGNLEASFPPKETKKELFGTDGFTFYKDTETYKKKNRDN